MGRGDLATLVHICDLAGRPRGRGFVADHLGTVVTSHESVDSLARVVLHAPGGRTALAEADAITPLAESGVALVRTEGLGVPPAPVSPRRRIAPGTGLRLPAPDWHEARAVAAVQVMYTATDRFHLIDEAVALALPPGVGEALRLGSAATGGPVLEAASGAVLAVLATALQSERRAAGFALPLRPLGLPEGPLAELLRRNAATVPAHGDDLNLAAVLELTAASLGPALGPVARPAPVRRPGVLRELDGSTALVRALVGDPGTGRTTALADLAAHRAHGEAPAPTVWLRGADLRAGDLSLADAVARVLRRAGRVLAASGVPAEIEFVTPERVAHLAREAGRPLLVVLDGPEEMPPALARRLPEWTRSTAGWLATRGARLLVGCRPEYWQRAAALQPSVAPHAPAVRLTGLSPAEAATVRERYGLPAGAIADADARHPLALRLLAEVRAALPGGAAGRPTREEVFAAHLDLLCLRIAVRVAAASRTAPRGSAVRRLAARTAGRVHEAARRCLGPGHGGLDRESFEELFPWGPGWAAAVLTEGLLVPAGTGYRFAHEEVGDWLQGRCLDLDAALRALVHRREPEPPAVLPSRPGRAFTAGRVPPPPGSALREPPPPLPVPPHRVGPVVQSLLLLDRVHGPSALTRRLKDLIDAVGEEGAAGADGAGCGPYGPDRSPGADAAAGRERRGGSGRAPGGAGRQGEQCGSAGQGQPGEQGGQGGSGHAGGPDGFGGPGRAGRPCPGGGADADDGSRGPGGRDGRCGPDGIGGRDGDPAAPDACGGFSGTDAPGGGAPGEQGGSGRAGQPGEQGATDEPGGPEREGCGGHQGELNEPDEPGDGAALAGDTRWWAVQLLTEVLVKLPDPASCLPMLHLLATRLTRRSLRAGGLEHAGGLAEFGPAFWERLRLTDTDRFDLYRRLLPADGPPGGARRSSPAPGPAPERAPARADEPAGAVPPARSPGPASGALAPETRSSASAPGAPASGAVPGPSASVPGTASFAPGASVPASGVAAPASGPHPSVRPAMPSAPEIPSPRAGAPDPAAPQPPVPPGGPAAPEPPVPSSAPGDGAVAVPEAEPRDDGPLDSGRPATGIELHGGRAPRVRFLDLVVARLEADPVAVQPLLCRWLGDGTPLPVAPGEGVRLTVGDVAQALLYARRGLAVDDLAEALVATGLPRAEELLGVLAEEEPSALCRAVDRWVRDARPERRAAAARYAVAVGRCAVTPADRRLLRYAAYELLSRSADTGPHGPALALLVRDPHTRARCLDRALTAFAAAAPGLLADAFVPALATHPEPVFAAFRARLLADDRAGEVLLALAEVTATAPARRAAELVAEHIGRSSRGADDAAGFVGRRLEHGPAARALLLPLVATALRHRPRETGRALAPVLAAAGSGPSGPLRAELLALLLEVCAAREDHEVLLALLVAAARSCPPGPGPAAGESVRPVRPGHREPAPAPSARELVHRAGRLLARSAEGARLFDRQLDRLIHEVPRFAVQLAGWLAEDPRAWAGLVGPEVRHRAEAVGSRMPMRTDGVGHGSLRPA